jgi:cyclopropane fatty-acyl-phospholipid synthase-like methyltransferase
MPTWNELFLNKENIKLFPQTEIYRFIKKVEGVFSDRPLRIWDHCCGGGRHSILASQMRHSVYSSDISENGLAHLKDWMAKESLLVEVEQSDMSVNPWNESFFHGVISWDAVHHNTIVNIEAAIETIRRSLVEGGMFISTLMSTKSLTGDDGEEVEKNTFLIERGADSGVLHHYFDRDEIEKVFGNWKPVVLAEQVIEYMNVEDEFWKTNPFPYTKWLVLMKR